MDMPSYGFGFDVPFLNGKVPTRDGAFKEAGDIVMAIRSGALQPDGVVADLFDLSRGRHPGRRSDDEITLFKSVGSAIEDLAAARLLGGGHRRIIARVVLRQHRRASVRHKKREMWPG